jgi:hypothetical protein
MPISSFNEVATVPSGSKEQKSYFVQFRHGALPYVDQLEQYFKENQPSEWEAFAKRVPGATLRRLFSSVSLDKLKGFLRAPVPADSASNTQSLLQYHVLDVPPGTLPKAVLEALKAWPQVRSAEQAIEAVDPTGTVDPRDDGMYPLQQYLQPAPLGVNAVWAWRIPGGTGAGQTVLDLERGWASNHVDLLDEAGLSRVRHVYGDNLAASAGHGAAVLGILCATDNGTHIVGMAPDTTRILLLSHSGNSANIPDAIVSTLLKLAPDGDLTHLPPGIVLLIETELRDEANRRWPVEHNTAIRQTLFYVNYWGVTIILAAGNGGANLDQYLNAEDEQIYLPGGTGFVDTGSLYVGAGLYQPEMDPANPWTRHAYSNYGRRVNCFAMGEKVATLWTNGQTPETGFTTDFKWTSSAAAIVAGGALCCQGMAWSSARLGRALKPAELRKLFSTQAASDLAGVRPHTTTADPARGGLGGIGVMPNLRFIGRKYFQIPDPPLPPDDPII